MIRTVRDMLERHPSTMLGFPYLVVDQDTGEVLRMARDEPEAREMVDRYRKLGRKSKAMPSDDPSVVDYKF